MSSVLGTLVAAAGGAAVAVYTAATVWLAAVALQTVALALSRLVLARRSTLRPTPPPDNAWPALVVQIPVYREPPALVARAVDAALALRAHGPVEVQVLDDSPDPASNARLCAARHTALRPVRHLTRAGREGYKAGALAAGLAATSAPLVAIFDVDFRPGPETLEALVPPLLADAQLAFVQARWTHPEADQTALGRAQAALLDLHFEAEQAGRHGLGLPVTFNGTAGVWRRRAIETAGGWHGDTLAEDLDLALRVQAAGWHAAVLGHVTVAADLPPSVTAWRRQQARWAKGLAEVGIKLGRTVWRSSLPVSARLSVTGQIAVAGSLPALLALVIAHPVAVLAGVPGLVAVTGLGALVCALVAHALVQRALYPSAWRRRLWALPWVLLAPLMLAVPATRAVGQALRGRHTPFQRTPKDPRRRADPDRGWDAALAGYSLTAAAFLAAGGDVAPALVQTGFGAAFAVAAWAGRGAVAYGARATGAPAVAGKPARQTV